MKKAGVDRLAALYAAIERVRRGGTVSISGVYGGAADPMPMMQLFDKQMQLRMGQANVRAWTTTSCRSSSTTRTHLAPSPSPPIGCRSSEAPEAYAKFRDKEDGMIKVVFTP